MACALGLLCQRAFSRTAKGSLTSTVSWVKCGRNRRTRIPGHSCIRKGRNDFNSKPCYRFPRTLATVAFNYIIRASALIRSRTHRARRRRGIARFEARENYRDDAIAALNADGHGRLLWNRKRDMADGVISPQQGRRPCPGDGRAIRRTGTPNSLLYATSSNTTPQTAPVTSVISWGPRSSFPRNARLSSNFKRYRKFVDSPLEEAGFEPSVPRLG